jgi:hypothetical protein
MLRASAHLFSKSMFASVKYEADKTVLNATDKVLRPVRGEMFIACNAKHLLRSEERKLAYLVNRNRLPLLRTEKTCWLVFIAINISLLPE